MRMMKMALRGAALAAVAACVLASPASAAGGPEIATMSSGASALVWQPAIAYERMVLTVSGPDGVFRTEFDAATAPSLDLYDGDGYPLADGVYRWELRAEPALPGHVRSALARARKTGDQAAVAELRRTGAIPSEPLVASGSFRVREGGFVQTGLDEDSLAGPANVSGAVTSMTAPDIVHADDVIINGGSGSLCVGLDCVNNENFGADTIRLKENNLRIHFDDTSNTASFPSRDWRIVANDQNNGGLERFTIEDASAGRFVFTIEGNAPTNSMYLDDGGRFGLGTSTPSVNAHIVTGNTPTLRLEQDGSSGFAAQTWDLAGNEANFFVRDVTNGSALPFRIEPGTASNTLYLDSGELVGIGTNAPSQELHVRGTDGDTMILVEEASGTNAQRALLELVNNGDVFLRQTNSATGQFVDLNLVSNEFRVNFGTGGAGPELRLTSNGDLIITGTYTPDYVFEPDYPLMALDELAAFIAEHRHLPNIPSDAEVRATRQVNVNEFQMRLLEKIEELTLYTLEQQSLIGELQSEVAKLKAPAAD